MFWSSLVAFFLILSTLGGCGWRPLYGQGQAGFEITEQLSAIEIETSKNSAGENLQTQLETLFYHAKPKAEKKMRLIISVSTQEQNVLIRFDDRARRRNLLATASYRLVMQKKDAGENKIESKKIFSDQTHAIISYNRSESEFANLTSRRDAQKRILNQLAFTIKQRIVAFLHAQTGNNRKQ